MGPTVISPVSPLGSGVSGRQESMDILETASPMAVPNPRLENSAMHVARKNGFILTFLFNRRFGVYPHLENGDTVNLPNFLNFSKKR